MAKTIKHRHLGLRISPELLKRATDIAWLLRVSLNTYCVDSIERDVIRQEKKFGGDEANGSSVRKVLPTLRGKSSTKG